ARIPRRQQPAHTQYACHAERKRQIEQRRSAQSTCLTPIEARMSEENSDVADKQAEEAQRIDPVGDADGGGVPRGMANYVSDSGLDTRKVGRFRHSQYGDRSTKK